MENNFFADVKIEGDNPFEALETETSTESQPENKQEEEEPVVVETPEEGAVETDEAPNTPEEEHIPFHKHPRWIERERELEELRAFRESVEPRLSEFDQVRTQLETQSRNNEEVPDWFVELYGDNDLAWAKYSARERQREEEIELRAIDRLERRQVEAQQESQKWVKFVDDGFRNLEDQGKRFNRNELANFMLENPITDANNNLDFEKSLNLFEKLNPREPSPTSTARKQLADSMTKSSTVENKKKDYLTPADLRGKSWNQIN